MTTLHWLDQTIHDKYTVWARLDNHNPAHEYFRGEISVVQSRVNPDEKLYVLTTNEAFMGEIMRGIPPIFLLDDGESVLPLFISGWGASMLRVNLSPFPTSQPTSRATTEDLGWALGPRTAYHLRVHE